jgi:hypothetical protein
MLTTESEKGVKKVPVKKQKQKNNATVSTKKNTF